MKIPVVGMDPSFSNWGIARGLLDLDIGTLEDVTLDICSPDVQKSKQVRQNSLDLARTAELAKTALNHGRWARAVFVEVPVGSQSARAMASYGACLGVLGSLIAEGIQIIEVTPTEAKRALAGKKTASKEEMIAAAVKAYPTANWPKHQGKITKSQAEHMADAIAAIHAGVLTPVFQNLMRLYKG